MYVWIKARGFLASQHRVNSDNYDLLKQVVITSDMVVTGSHFVFAKELADGRLHALSIDDCPQWTPSILIAPAARHSKVASGLVECMRCELVTRIDT